MLFNSRVFILGFLPMALAGYWAFGQYGRRAALTWLLICSLSFYAWWKPPFVALLIASITVNYGIGVRIQKSSYPSPWLILGISFNLGILGFFKYTDFVAGVIDVRPPFGGIYLPLGISFFTFQQVMYLVDVEKRDIKAVRFLEYACFIAFFPHLIAGPIVRPGHILPQFSALQPRIACRVRIAAGLEVFLLGLAKKLVLADGFARFANAGFAAAARLDRISFIEAWVALLAYALQIYFDFSGYSDMAIGLARCFGIEFPVNFQSPYKARNISDFWRRWNITLSAFLKDYLYIPLGGNQRGEARRILNLFTTMLLGGLWHGAAWKFLLWGGLHGVFLMVHGWSRRLGLRLPAGLCWATTLLCVVLAWVPFRAAGFDAAIDLYRGLAGFNGLEIPAILTGMLPILVHVGHQVSVLPYLGDARTLSFPEASLWLILGWFIVLKLPDIHQMSPRRRGAALIAGFALTAQGLFFAPDTVPFLYFQF